MLMAGGKLTFRIPPVCESCAASITIRQRIGRRIKRKKIGLENFSLLGFNQADRDKASGITTENRFFCLFYYLLEIPEFSNISSTYCFCSFALSAFLLLGFVAIVSKYFLAK